jgi:acyl carrier protein
MSAAKIRSTVAHALQDANVAEHVASSRIAAFEKGEGDIPLSDLTLDSLSRMELLVALEMEYGAVILPHVFAQFRSLSDIVAYVESSRAGLEAAPVTHASGEPEAAAQHESAPRIARLFKRAFGHCRTVAEMLLLLSHLADRMTPLEAATFREWQRAGRLLPSEAPSKFAAALSDWFDAFEAAMRGSGKSEPEPFKGRRVSPAIMHYTGPGERADKTLLVCFSVKGNRSLSIALAPFLQHLDASQYDVLIVADLWATAFRSGVPFLGADIHEVVRSVAGLAFLRDYARIRATGCSAGVYPAMLTGRHLGAELTVGFNGRFPSERRLGTLIGMYINCWKSARRNRDARVLLIHAMNTRRDAAFARRLGRLTGTSRLAVEMPDRDLKHSVLPPLVHHGELKYFFEQTLLAPVDSPWFAERGAVAAVRFPLERVAGSLSAS